MNRDWTEHALCRKPGVDPSWWFPEAGHWSWRVARWYCKRCPVRNECLRDALQTGDTQFGIRAGLNSQQRRLLARIVKAAA